MNKPSHPASKDDRNQKCSHAEIARILTVVGFFRLPVSHWFLQCQLLVIRFFYRSQIQNMFLG